MSKSQRKLGPYVLVKTIGRGAFGVVWLAEKQTAIATTQFALKLPRDEDIDIEAFKQEATIWVQASGHPNVLTLIEADIYDGQVVIVSEYLPDGSLSSWLRQHVGRAPSLEAACEMIDGVLAGLDHLHQRRIIHRDLKPDNILLRGETPRLADFGIARLLRSTSYSTNISGTLSYMAPECFDGKRNEQTDIWSVGVILYQMLSGRLPYEQQDAAAFVGAILRHDPPVLSHSVPGPLRRIVDKALQREPTSRYATAREMRTELREASRRLWVEQLPELEAAGNQSAPQPAVTEKWDPLLVDSALRGSTEETRITPAASEVATKQASDTIKDQHVVSQETVAAATVAAIPSIDTSLKPRPIETIAAVQQKAFTPAVKIGGARKSSKWSILIPLGIIIFVIAVLGGWWVTTRVRTVRVKAQADQDLSDVKVAFARVVGKGFTNKLGMKFALIPNGSFMMGSNTGAEEEQPVHRVTISQDFYMQTTEVTQAQWFSVMKFNSSYYLWPTHPVDRVVWSSAQDFIKQLNELNDGYNYRLPTEAQWEYACRAGTTGDYYGELDSVCWYQGNSQGQMQEVGKKQPNAFGLYDMLGNAQEWCQDSYDWKYYQVSPETDPTGPAEATDTHVVRGGAFSYDAKDVRSAARQGNANPFVIQGFRVAATRIR